MPETDLALLWLSEPYIEIISEVLSRYEGSRLRSSCADGLSLEREMGRCGWRKSPRLARGCKAVVGLPVLMEKRPMLPVSVVFLSMPSAEAAGSRKVCPCSLILRRGLK